MKLTNAVDQVDTSIGVRLETLHDQNTLKRDSPMTASYWIRINGVPNSVKKEDNVMTMWTELYFDISET